MTEHIHTVHWTARWRVLPAIFPARAALAVLAALGLCLASGPARADVMPADFRQKQSDKVWEEQLRKPSFQDRQITEGVGQDVISVKAPIAAEDASLVPISIHSKIPQTPERYIERMSVFVDKNPVPLVGNFEFTPMSGRADLALRIRVDDFSYVRVVAETNDGQLYMAKSFVRAKGACSAPPPASIEDSRRLLGKMRMRALGEVVYGQPSLMQLMIYHPNITGMAPIRIGSRVRPPPFFVKDLQVHFQEQLVMRAEMTFSISMDPSMRFFFLPEQSGDLVVSGTDTKNNEFQSRYLVKAGPQADPQAAGQAAGVPGEGAALSSGS